MSLAAKLGVLGITGAGITVGGIFLLNHLHKPIPKWHSLANDNNYESSGYTSKFGDDYKDYLIGISQAKSQTIPESNDAWWNWAYEYLFQAIDNHKGKFKKVKTAIGDSGSAESLREVCGLAYKETSNGDDAKIKTTDPTDDNHFKESDIWKYCSPLDKKPSTISSRSEETKNYQNKLGSDTSHNTKLVSVIDQKNDTFWNLKQKLFFENSEPTSQDEKYFQKIYKDNKNKKENLILKKACGEAYNMTANSGTSSESSPKTTEVVKYCSLEGK